MPPFSLNVNGRRRRVSLPADTPLLWALRDTLGLTGTKYGCGVGDALSGNLCRCGTYQRIRTAVHRAAGEAI